MEDGEINDPVLDSSACDIYDGILDSTMNVHESSVSTEIEIADILPFQVKDAETKSEEAQIPPEEAAPDTTVTTFMQEDSDDDSIFDILNDPGNAIECTELCGDFEENIGDVPIKTKNEKDLPLVEPIDIEIPAAAKIHPIGAIYSAIQTCMVVQSFPDTQVLDVDTILVTGERNPIGRIDDVFGPVTLPFYSIRFNNREDIQDDWVVGLHVFYVPELSKIVDKKNLNVKGSDASNIYDEEISEGEMEFSDDEKEMEFKKRRKNQNKEKFNKNHKQESKQAGRNSKSFSDFQASDSKLGNISLDYNGPTSDTIVSNAIETLRNLPSYNNLYESRIATDLEGTGVRHNSSNQNFNSQPGQLENIFQLHQQVHQSMSTPPQYNHVAFPPEQMQHIYQTLVQQQMNHVYSSMQGFSHPLNMQMNNPYVANVLAEQQRQTHELLLRHQAQASQARYRENLNDSNMNSSEKAPGT